MGTIWYPKKKKPVGEKSEPKEHKKKTPEQAIPFKVRCIVCTGRGYVRDKHTKKERPCLMCRGKGEIKTK